MTKFRSSVPHSPGDPISLQKEGVPKHHDKADIEVVRIATNNNNKSRNDAGHIRRIINITVLQSENYEKWTFQKEHFLCKVQNDKL